MIKRHIIEEGGNSSSRGRCYCLLLLLLLDAPPADAAAAVIVLRVLSFFLSVDQAKEKEEEEEERDLRQNYDRHDERKKKVAYHGLGTHKLKGGTNWHHHTACLLPWLAGVVCALPSLCSFPAPLPPSLPPYWIERLLREITPRLSFSSSAASASLFLEQRRERERALLTDWILSF
jgi:hypothetical protein